MARSAAPGRLFGLMAAAFLGVNTTFARLAYDGGSNPFTVLGSRFLFCSIAIALAVAVRRQACGIPRGSRLATLGVTIVWFAAPTSYLSSVFFLPVSLAALIFYTFPLLVVAASPFVQGARIGSAGAGAFLLAFAGLAIALSPTLHSLDWRGLALASLGAVGTAMTLILSRRLVVEQGVVTFSLTMNAGSAVLITVLTGIAGKVALPQVASGWIGLGGATVFFLVGILAMFAAIRDAGSAVTALIMNLEPMVSILAAAIVLGERLTLPQLAGAIMVVGALVIAARERTG